MPRYTKERWVPEERAWFEYHCYEGHDSSDAIAWYHSHQMVTILAGPFYDGVLVPEGDSSTYNSRAEEGAPNVYEVKFYTDGLEYTVFEDELLTHSRGFFRPDPPPAPGYSCDTCGENVPVAEIATVNTVSGEANACARCRGDRASRTDLCATCMDENHGSCSLDPACSCCQTTIATMADEGTAP